MQNNGLPHSTGMGQWMETTLNHYTGIKPGLKLKLISIFSYDMISLIMIILDISCFELELEFACRSAVSGGYKIISP